MAVAVVESPAFGPVVVCDRGAEFLRVISSGEARPVFLKAELEKLAKAPREVWADVMTAKAVFPGSVVTAYRRRKKRPKRRPSGNSRLRPCVSEQVIDS